MQDIFKVDNTSPSGILWIGSKKYKLNGKPAGYIQYRENGKPKKWSVEFNGKNYAVHRLVWEITKGVIPSQMEIDHLY